MADVEMFAPHSVLAGILLQKAGCSSTDGSHDLSHLLRVWKNVTTMERAEGGDLEILTAAVILHDCVPVEKNSPLRKQASRVAAVQASEILSSVGWLEERTAAVHHAIHAHSFSAGVTPKTLEARILQDADRLDAMGAIGIARCFYTAGRLNSSLYDPQDPTARHRVLDDSVFALDHFPAKLLGLCSGFQTVTGAQLAEERHARLTAFYEGFLVEL